ncbi:hypothetical protein V8G54_008377 [Vigna mungo]|uniref:Integrase catalytic domain-containing protein n=1 Tax=Vigna mungo TaxID=3915 RepID=A0AAQ3P521_VIGMU
MSTQSSTSQDLADGLSRLPDASSVVCYALSTPNFIFIDQLRQSVNTSSAYTKLLARIQTDPAAHPDYKLHNGLILFKNCLWLNLDNTFRLKLIDEYHTPTTVLEDLSLDFITGLPSSQGFTIILVVEDSFSKGVHLRPLPHHYSASKVAHLFLDIIYKYHGLPRSLVSDHDPIFISKFWHELFRLYGTRLRMSTSYHPETDEQKQSLITLLLTLPRSILLSILFTASQLHPFPITDWVHPLSKLLIHYWHRAKPS